MSISASTSAGTSAGTSASTSASTATRIQPCLWFDTQLEEAAAFWTAIFPNSSIGPMSRYPGSGPGETGAVMAGEFTLDGTTFRAINGGPQFTFSEAVSFSITCADQGEVDHYWSALTAGGGEESVCGWLKDRYGVSWQVVPARLYELLTDPDRARADAATEAMMQMRKIVVADLEAAADAVAATSV